MVSLLNANQPFTTGKHLSAAVKVAAIEDLLSSSEKWAQVGHSVTKMTASSTSEAEIEAIQKVKSCSDSIFRAAATKLRAIGQNALSEGQQVILAATEKARATAGGHPDAK